MEKHNVRKPISGILVAAMLVAILTCAAVAAVRYLTPGQVAGEVGGASVAQAFEAPDAITMNETQICGDYTVTLLGAVSGENLNEHMSDGTLDKARSYLVAAVERTDGAPIEQAGETGIQFSPLVSGYALQVNAWTLFGGCTSFVQDGVEYILFDYNTLEPFADHTVYFAAYEGFVPSREIFAVDEETGEISFAESYTGPQALFVLPLDSSKADSAAAAEILQKAGIA